MGDFSDCNDYAEQVVCASGSSTSPANPVESAQKYPSPVAPALSAE